MQRESILPACLSMWVNVSAARRSLAGGLTGEASGRKIPDYGVDDMIIRPPSICCDSTSRAIGADECHSARGQKALRDDSSHGRKKALY